MTPDSTSHAGFGWLFEMDGRMVVWFGFSCGSRSLRMDGWWKWVDGWLDGRMVSYGVVWRSFWSDGRKVGWCLVGWCPASGSVQFKQKKTCTGMTLYRFCYFSCLDNSHYQFLNNAISFIFICFNHIKQNLDSVTQFSFQVIR